MKFGGYVKIKINSIVTFDLSGRLYIVLQVNTHGVPVSVISMQENRVLNCLPGDSWRGAHFVSKATKLELIIYNAKDSLVYTD